MADAVGRLPFKHQLDYRDALCLVQVQPVKELRERHLGVLEGLTRSEAAVQHPADFANLSGSPDAKPKARKSL